MVLVDPASVPARLRSKRKLMGLTQAQLAQRANFSESLIKKVEQGTQPASAALVAGCAKVLGVTTAYLWGVDHHDVVDAPEVDVAGVGELRSALDSWDDPRPAGDPLTLRQIRHRLDRAGRDLYGLKYAEVSRRLPNLLHHLYPLAEQQGRDGELARGALHDAYRMIATVAGRFRAADLAAIASERHQSLAPSTSDPLRVAISMFTRATPHLQRGDYVHGLRVIDRARAYLDTTPAGRSMAIQLHLRSAVLAARDAQPDLADDHIDSARAISEEFDPPGSPYYNVMANRTNIDVHWCAAPVENYDGAEAVRRSLEVRIIDPGQPERVGHHHIDMARAWLLYGDRDQVIANLNAARRVAPFNTRQHPSVRETVLTLAEQDRRATDSLAGFARWAGIEL